MFKENCSKCGHGTIVNLPKVYKQSILAGSFVCSKCVEQMKVKATEG